LNSKNLHTSFGTTNSDVVVAEALYWVWWIIANLMFADFNAAVAIAETDERGIKVPRSEMYNLYALRPALELTNAQIEAETGWGAEALVASRLEIYGSIHDAEGPINAFAQRGLCP
jgi:hypothetical protein